MKRMHVHVAVRNIDQSVSFYSTLFAVAPTVLKRDYAKWMLDDPRVNFSISSHGAEAGMDRVGVDHLGIQVEDPAELGEVYGRLAEAGRPVLEEGKTTCCYAQSEKSWITDPQGVAWETFHTTGESATFGTSAPLEKIGKAADASGCAPATDKAAAPGKASAFCG
jgi:catechol-2,3-dioxygenase